MSEHKKKSELTGVYLPPKCLTSPNRQRLQLERYLPWAASPGMDSRSYLTQGRGAEDGAGIALLAGTELEDLA